MTEHAASAGDDPPRPSGEGAVTVVGTAHVSEHSVEEVETSIEETRPDIVAVELDEGRYKQMQGEAPDDLDAGDLLRGNTVFQFLAYWMLSYIQTRLGDRFDIEPGADMKAAIDKAEELGLGVALVDRDIQTTVQRFWARLSFREKVALVGSLAAEMGPPLSVGLTIGATIGAGVAVVAGAFGGPFVVPPGFLAGILPGGIASTIAGLLDTLLLVVGASLVVGLPIAALLARFHSETDDVEEFDIEQLTETDVVSAMMEEFRQFSPGGAEALIDERDAFIAHRLVGLREAGYDVLAVVGAGHRAGIEHYLEHPEELPPLESLTGTEDGRRISLYQVVGYGVGLVFLVFFGLLILGGASQAVLLELFVALVVVNAVFAGGLAKVAGSHWSSAIVAGAFGWLTSLFPLLAAGWFAGYVELRYISVNVGDIAKLNEILGDEQAPISDLLARMRAVPLFRLILIVALTNIGSAVASYVVFPALLPYLAADIGGMAGVTSLLWEGINRGTQILVGAL
ncbi:TraB/GumN family protein [Haloarcula nitratireducens]|uniref:TraB/GumN family protein n=1 Tax=Haloarcula nitratireducens TaxID=2487749 RepID=A0AAW4P838_9EURY|nr:TraB/GumN family protein [Halomicroarcula nitratireducens]MBX0294004.1 TraB/GumN family protein [Halomicroarcula nitratireducens]